MRESKCKPFEAAPQCMPPQQNENHTSAADAVTVTDAGRPCHTGREREQQELEAQREAEQQRRERRREQWRWLARLPEPSSQPGETYAPNYRPSFAVDEASLAVDEASLKEHVPPPPPPDELDTQDAPGASEGGEGFDVRPGEFMLRNGPHQALLRHMLSADAPPFAPSLSSIAVRRALSSKGSFLGGSLFRRGSSSVYSRANSRTGSFDESAAPTAEPTPRGTPTSFSWRRGSSGASIASRRGPKEESSPQSPKALCGAESDDSGADEDQV